MSSDIRGYLKKSPKFYGVQAGHTPGVYTTWEDAEAQIKGFQGARHKSFGTAEEAEEFVKCGPIVRECVISAGLLDPSPLGDTMNPAQRAAFDAVMAGKSIFLTGPGGTGKSFLLQSLHDQFKLRAKKLAITAMTGCAAVLIGPFAKTLHSWAGIGLGRGDPEKIAEEVASHKRKGPNWRKTTCLVIDEVSMMTPGLLELLDVVGRKAKKCEKPFGGMQMVFVGDFYQLPPVSQGPAAFAFNSPLWSKVIEENHILTEIVRQKDPIFQRILNEARMGELSPESYEILESRKTMDWKRQEIKPTLLFTKNNDVSTINENQLRKLPGEEHVFKTETDKPADMSADVAQMLADKLDRDAPYEVELRLKERAQVMLVKKLYEEKEDDKGKKTLTPIPGLVNGSRGVVTGFSADGLPVVKFLNGKTMTVRQAEWCVDDEPSTLKRIQIPLRVAYALTIHKAQGASLDSALVDVGPSTFECGQAYVALSRVRNLDALYVFEISPKAFRAHPAVKAFYATLLG